MKLVNLINDFRPCFMCGEALSTVTGMLGGTYAVKASQENVSHQLSAQRSENQLNRDWQTQQAEVDRQFQAGQTLQQNQFQQGLQAQQQKYNLQSMQQQAQYNSPVYMRQQLQQSGINPQVYFGNHASFSGSSAVAGGAPAAPSAPSGRMPGSVQGLSPVGFQPNFLNPAELFNGVAQGLKALGEAKKAGVDISFLEETLGPRIQKAIAEGNIAKQQELLGDIEVAFNRANFGTRLNTAFSNYKKVLSEIDLNSEKRLTEQEEQKLKRSTADLNKSIQLLNEEDKRRLGITISYLPRLLESEILSNRGSAVAGFSSGRAQVAKAKFDEFTNNMRDNFRYEEYDRYLSGLVKDRVLSEADAAEARRKLSVLKNVSGNEWIKKFDEATEWVKSKLKIFGN